MLCRGSVEEQMTCHPNPEQKATCGSSAAVATPVPYTALALTRGSACRSVDSSFHLFLCRHEDTGADADAKDQPDTKEERRLSEGVEAQAAD